jgi:hypothetical protein
VVAGSNPAGVAIYQDTAEEEDAMATTVKSLRVFQAAADGLQLQFIGADGVAVALDLPKPLVSQLLSGLVRPAAAGSSPTDPLPPSQMQIGVGMDGSMVVLGTRFGGDLSLDIPIPAETAKNLGQDLQRAAAKARQISDPSAANAPATDALAFDMATDNSGRFMLRIRSGEEEVGVLQLAYAEADQLADTIKRVVAGARDGKTTQA